MKTEILTIGDEILIGQITDTNSAWIANRLLQENILINRMISLADKRTEMLEVIDCAFQRSDVVIITGGLGPTKDDLTKEVLAEYFESGWHWDEESLRIIDKLFSQRNRELKEINKKQAYLPDNCKAIANHWGTAPGMLFQKNNKILISLPGVPFEMQNMMDTYVVNEIKKRFKPTPVLVHHFLTVNVPESLLAERLAEVEDSLPKHFKLAYLPHLNIVRLRLTCSIENEQIDKTLFDDFVSRFRAKLGNDLVTEQNISLEEHIYNLLKAKNKTISFAESCTGGLISSSFTQTPGVSAVYSGAVISYSNEVKNKVLGVPEILLSKHGAVSAEVASAMAEGCRLHLNSDYALSVTGIAGPDGGTEEKPVGTVYIGLSSAHGTITEKLFYPSKRHRIMEYSMIAVFNLLRRNL
ncbi:MAG: competence/damage-inducible protein A [Bacteroidia bacterium]|nr:competence/damage-inducible protein A [Bacteroidia bacterium]